jgi:hypothetical protein
MATSSRRTRFAALGAVSYPVLDRYLAAAAHVCKRPPTRLVPRFRISGEERSSSTPATWWPPLKKRLSGVTAIAFVN